MRLKCGQHITYSPARAHPTNHSFLSDRFLRKVFKNCGEIKSEFGNPTNFSAVKFLFYQKWFFDWFFFFDFLPKNFPSLTDAILLGLGDKCTVNKKYYSTTQQKKAKKAHLAQRATFRSRAASWHSRERIAQCVAVYLEPAKYNRKNAPSLWHRTIPYHFVPLRSTQHKHNWFRRTCHLTSCHVTFCSRVSSRHVTCLLTSRHVSPHVTSRVISRHVTSHVPTWKTTSDMQVPLSWDHSRQKFSGWHARNKEKLWMEEDETAYRQMRIMRYRQSVRQTERQTVRQIDRQTDRQTDRQSVSQTDIQTDRPSIGRTCQ